MLRLGAIVMNVSDVERAGAFWAEALGYPREPHNPAFLAPPTAPPTAPATAPPTAPATRLHLDEDDRTHLDLWADDETEQLAEVERLISLGASRVEWEYPEHADFIVLADPDGNLFCVVDLSH